MSGPDDNRPTGAADADAPQYPPASDARDAVAGSRYVPSGDLGRWWIASIGGILSGSVCGLAAGMLFLMLVSGGRYKKLIIIVLVVIAIISLVSMAGLVRLAKVRSLGFTTLLGLGTGAAFSYCFLCGACQIGFKSKFDPSTAFSNWCAAAIDVGALWSTLGVAFPNPGVFWTVIGGACVVTGLMVVFARYIAHEFTNGFMYDEANGGWFVGPERIACVAAFADADAARTGPGSLRSLDFIRTGLVGDFVEGKEKWGEVLVHRARVPGELEVVSRRNATLVKKKQLFAKPKFEVSYKAVGEPFFASSDEVDEVRAGRARNGTQVTSGAMPTV